MLKKLKEPPKVFGWQSCDVVAVIQLEEPCGFPIAAERSVSISVKTLFFFLEVICFWAEKPYEFPILAEKSITISDEPCEFDSRAMTILVKVAYSCLALSKSPPLFQILATHLSEVV